MFFFKNNAEYEAGRLVPDLFLFHKKANIFQYISIALTLTYNKNKLHKNLGYCFRDMLNFKFSKKGLGVVSPQHFVYNFSRKIHDTFP